MRVNSGVTRHLSGELPRRTPSAPARASTTERPAPRASAGATKPRRDVAAERLRARCSQPASAAPTLGSGPAPSMRRMRALAAATGLVGASLLGCTSLPAWQVAPAYRVEGGAQAAAGFLAMARQHAGEGRTALAADAYRRAAEALPTHPDLHNQLGLALAGNGQFGPAVAALRRAVALAPDRAPLLNNLGYALLLDGRLEDARAMLRLALAIDPAHPTAGRNLGHVEQQIARAAGAPEIRAGHAADSTAPAAHLAPTVALSSVPASPTVATGARAATPSTVAALTAASAEPAADAAAVRPAASAHEAAPSATPGAGTPAASDAASIPAGSAAAGIPAALAAAGTPAAPAAPGIPAPAAAGVPSAPASLAGASIEIVNGNGISGAAARMRQVLRDRGLEVARLGNRRPYDSPYTTVLYRPGKADMARALAQRIPVPAAVAAAPAGTARADLSVLLGHDLRPASACAAPGTCEGPDPRVASGAAPAVLR